MVAYLDMGCWSCNDCFVDCIDILIKIIDEDYEEREDGIYCRSNGAGCELDCGIIKRG